MAEALSQLLYRLMRDNGLTAYQLSVHIRQCSSEPATFSKEELGEFARNLAADLIRVSQREAA
jgi:hypothetical protein